MLLQETHLLNMSTVCKGQITGSYKQRKTNKGLASESVILNVEIETFCVLV